MSSSTTFNLPLSSDGIIVVCLQDDIDYYHLTIRQLEAQIKMLNRHLDADERDIGLLGKRIEILKSLIVDLLEILPKTDQTNLLADEIRSRL